MNPPPPEPPTAANGLVFDWHHRPRTWPRLTFWLLAVLAVHVAGFILFSVRTPPPARAMPVPASLVLAADRTADPAEPAGAASFAGPLSPAESADLDLPENVPIDPEPPSFATHTLTRQPWPTRPERATWPEVSGVSRAVLPPAPAPAPAPAPEAPATAPR
jgi:hypothetical protein